MIALMKTCKELVESLTVVGTHQTEGEVWQDRLHGGENAYNDWLDSCR